MPPLDISGVLTIAAPVRSGELGYGACYLGKARGCVSMAPKITNLTGMIAVSESNLRVRFDGPILAGHSMDVNDLAPSLLAIADLCKNANKKFNGDRTAVKVLVNADLKQNCFELNLELVMTIIEVARQLISLGNIRDAKEILEWLGLISSVGGLIALVQKISNRPIEKVEYVSNDGRDQIKLTITGDNNRVHIYASPEAFDLAKDPANIRSVKRIVEPLTKDGYETLQFDQGNNGIQTITRQDAREIMLADPEVIADTLDDKEEPQIVTAWVRVYAPVYEKDAQTWRFWYGDHSVYMDVSETDIAENAIRRGGALVDDTYRVKLEIVQSKTSTKMRYKILEVLEFRPANLYSQVDLNLNP